ncbi:viral A-type inclusion protein, partial [Reticulomyxa filosa]
YKQQNESKTRALEQLNNDFETYKNERYDSIERQNGVLNQQLKALKDENDEFRMKVMELESTNRQQDQVIQQLRSDYEDAKQRVSLLQNQLQSQIQAQTQTQTQNQANNNSKAPTAPNTMASVLPQSIAYMKPEWVEAIEHVLRQMNNICAKFVCF